VENEILVFKEWCEDYNLLLDRHLVRPLVGHALFGYLPLLQQSCSVKDLQIFMFY
jgi:hypothetical protein